MGISWPQWLVRSRTNKFHIKDDGTLRWGPGGTAAPDTSLYRYAADELRTDATLNPDAQGSQGLGTINNWWGPLWAKELNIKTTSSDDARISTNAGTPEGVVTGNPGDVCLDVTNGQAYVKASGTGSTGWKELSTAAKKKSRKLLDEIVNNSSTLQDDDSLFVALGANEAWSFEAFLLGTTPSLGTDIKIAFTIPTGASISWAVLPSWTPLDAFEVSTVVTGSGTAKTIGLGSTTRAIHIRGFVSTDATAGNLQLQWAQGLATVEDTKLLVNSYILAEKF